MGWTATSPLASLLSDAKATQHGGFASSGMARLYFLYFLPSPPHNASCPSLCWHMKCLWATKKPSGGLNRPVKKSDFLRQVLLLKIQHCWAASWELFGEEWDTSAHSCAQNVYWQFLPLHREMAECNFTIFQLLYIFTAVLYGGVH